MTALSLSLHLCKGGCHRAASASTGIPSTLFFLFSPLFLNHGHFRLHCHGGKQSEGNQQSCCFNSGNCASLTHFIPQQPHHSKSIQGTVHHSHTSFRNNHTTVNPQTGILNSIKEELSTKEKKSSHAVLSKIMCYKGQWGDTSNKYCVFSHASRVHHLDGGFPSLVLG